MKERGLLTLVAVVACMGLTSAALALTLTSGENALFVADGAVRFKSLANTGSRELYLGVPDLGVASNRVETDAIWVSGDNDVTFEYDDSAGKMKASVANSGGTWSLEYALEPTCGDWNALLMILTDRDEGTVLFEDVEMGSEAVGSFSGTGWNFWTVTDIDLSGDFTLTGTIDLSGSFSGDEVSKVEIKLGCVPGQEPGPGIPVMPIVALPLALIAVGAVVWRRR